MKIQKGQAAAFCAGPPSGLRGVLIYGDDAAQVTQRRRVLLDALLGPDAEEEMRLETLGAARLRSEPSALQDALRARGFFAGKRAVWVSDATDGLAEPIGDALAQAADPEAVLVVTAGALASRSALRAMFEAARDAASLPCYGDPPDRAALTDMLRKAGCASTPEGLEALQSYAATTDVGALSRFIEVLALYKLGDAAPLTPEDVSACAPVAMNAEVDEIATAVANRHPDLMRVAAARLAAQGVAPTTIVIATLRRFQILHMLTTANEPATAAIGRIRPPIFGPRRDALIAEARRWSPRAIETALMALLELDGALRGGTHAPLGALMERTLLRIALTPER